MVSCREQILNYMNISKLREQLFLYYMNILIVSYGYFSIRQFFNLVQFFQNLMKTAKKGENIKINRTKKTTSTEISRKNKTKKYSGQIIGCFWTP